MTFRIVPIRAAHDILEQSLYAASIYQGILYYRPFLQLPEKQTKAGVYAIYISAEGEDRSTNGRWGRDKGHWHDFIEREYLVHLCLDDSGGKCQFAARMKKIRHKRNEEEKCSGRRRKTQRNVVQIFSGFSTDFLRATLLS